MYQLQDQKVPLTYLAEQLAEPLDFQERKKFLIVEDDFSMQQIWEAIIKEVDPKAVIRWATTEEGAEKLIRDRIKMNDEFDLIIADILLAGKKNGVDLWRRYGQNNSLFLFASGITSNKFAEMVGDGAEKYPFFISKPLNPKRCVENVRTLLAYKNVFIGDSN